MKKLSDIPNSHIEILEEHYQLRLKRNPNYSLGAYARDIGISLAQLSSILKGRRGLSLQAGEKIAERLDLTDSVKEFFLAYIQAKHSRNHMQKKAAQLHLEKKKNSHVFFLKEDIFKIVSDWQHFAILELITLDGFQADVTWIASQLAIDPYLCKESIDRLFRVGLLEQQEQKWLVAGNYVMGPDEIKSDSIKKFHHQMINKANQALDSQELNEREFGNVMFTMNASDMTEAKQMLKDFRKNFAKYFRSKNQRDVLYSLNMQLFKVSQNTKIESKMVSGASL